ncbi:putative baseplate assembly protein [Bradyrhizobium sp. Arg816]|uniref:putative baseplate assembly protein n=1 Tax=Bradyrhizobium sp. Arg816 TaxID=2998491 RepID=UPI00249F2686|nr:putative baseplate assembly protein [Bradyrhizobium sp. Arg816]MDI3560168.1 putative baseplate assembly protein [Bradyrhizobium sp. Arg816]
MNQICQQDDRRDAVRRREGWNGLDYVELAADGQSLRAFFLGKLPPEFTVEGAVPAAHLALDGGDRISGIAITDVEVISDPNPEHDDQLLIRLSEIGDFSAYILRLVDVVNVDPFYASAEFHFRLDCPAGIDCAPACDCGPEAAEGPELDYLAKDYGGFRQLLMDRMALLVPDWRERHAPDLGVALVELLAYVGDYLSYHQDAVGTEAYLETARQRISVRRHLRLIDYRLHEGCNARALVCCQVDTDVALDPAKTSFVTGLNDGLSQDRTVLSWSDLRATSADAYEVFEPMAQGAPIQLRAAHSEIRIYTFGRTSCCLEKGSTAAALVDAGLHLVIGDIVIFEEVKGPYTGLPFDADPTKRHAVRLTDVTAKEDPVVLTGDDQPTRYVWIEWDIADALPFDFCLSAIGAAPDCRYLTDITIVRGNVVVVDHGCTQPPEDLGCVPTVTSEACCVCADLPGLVEEVPGKFRPSLGETPLTWRQPLDPATPAATLQEQDPRAAAPAVALQSTPPKTWGALADLIEAGPTDPAFVVEIDNDGIAWLRFGDGDLGGSLEPGMCFTGTYRIGNGIRGNVGAEAISRLVLRDATLDGVGITVRNPLPAGGGIEPEPVQQARLLAPRAVHAGLERAVIADDYATIAARDPHLQRAAASLIWTGSWYEADVALDPLGAETAPPALIVAVQSELEHYRRIGHDLHVRPAKYVPLDIRLEICVAPGHRAADVGSGLLDVFSNRLRRDGTPGFFYPDRLSFGDGVYLSQLVAAAQAVPGVSQAWVTRLHRRFVPPNHEIDNGVLPLKPWEIAQLDNDPDHSERGRFELHLREGC